jgi:hypothetical protein
VGFSFPYTDRTVGVESEFSGGCDNYTSRLAGYFGILADLSIPYGEVRTKVGGRASHTGYVLAREEFRIGVFEAVDSGVEGCFDSLCVCIYSCEVMPYDPDLCGV